MATTSTVVGIVVCVDTRRTTARETATPIYANVVRPAGMATTTTVAGITGCIRANIATANLT